MFVNIIADREDVTRNERVHSKVTPASVTEKSQDETGHYYYYILYILLLYYYNITISSDSGLSIGL